MGQQILSNRQYRKLRGCDGKIPYDHKRQAEAIAQGQRRHPAYQGKRGRLLTAYHCGACGKWHVGHNSV